MYATLMCKIQKRNVDEFDQIQINDIYMIKVNKLRGKWKNERKNAICEAMCWYLKNNLQIIKRTVSYNIKLGTVYIKEIFQESKIK